MTVNTVGGYVGSTYGISNGVTLAFSTRSKHYLGKNPGILRTLMSDDSADTARSYNYDF